MLISPATAAGIADGSVTLAFRRWDRPRMRPGSTQRTVAGVVRIDSVDEVDPDALTEDDARRSRRPRRWPSCSGCSTGGTARTSTGWGLAWPAPIPGSRCASRPSCPTEDRRGPRRAAGPLGRRPRRRPWTREVLRLIADRPGVRAPDLAASLGRETLPFKRDVRKLKELGLTRSLPVGYEISPRGRAYLG